METGEEVSAGDAHTTIQCYVSFSKRGRYEKGKHQEEKGEMIKGLKQSAELEKKREGISWGTIKPPPDIEGNGVQPNPGGKKTNLGRTEYSGEGGSQQTNWDLASEAKGGR